MTGRPAAFWEELARIWEAQPPHTPFTFMRQVYEALSRGPACASPDDPPPAKIGLALWEDFYIRPRHRWTARSAELREDIRNDELAELEALRISALLALRTLDPDQRDQSGIGPLRSRAREYLHAWAREIMRRSSHPGDLYFEKYRRDDTRTHTGLEADRREPTVHEMCSLVLNGEREDELRPAFRNADSSALLAEVHAWLVRHYAFREASRLLKALRQDKEQATRHARIDWQGLLLPRLFASTVVGHIAIATQTDFWRLADWLVDNASFPGFRVASGTPRFGTWPILQAAAHWGLALYVLVALAVFVFLIGLEIDQRTPLLRQRPNTRVVLTGLGESAIVALFTTILACQVHMSFLSPNPDRSWVGLGAVATVTGLLLGYLLQILWDDKSISDRL